MIMVMAAVGSGHDSDDDVTYPSYENFVFVKDNACKNSLFHVVVFIIAKKLKNFKYLSVDE